MKEKDNLETIRGAVSLSEGPGGKLSTKELWELGRRIEITVPVVDPQVRCEDGSGGQGVVVFRTFVTDVSDPETGEDLGMVSGGTGCVVITHKDYDGMWQIPHDELWYAFCEAVKDVGPIPVVPRPEPEIIKAEPLPPELQYEPKPKKVVKSGPVVYLYVTSYLVGIHYRARLSTCVEDEIDVEYELTKGQAERLSDPTYKYKAGSTSMRFMTKEAAIQRGMEVWKEKFPEGEVLILGNRAVAQAQAVLDGLDEEIRSRLNSLYLECYDLGFWDAHPEDMPLVKEANREWARVFNEAMGREVFRWT